VFATFPIPADWPEQQVKIASEEITPHVQRKSYREAEGLKQVVFEVPQLVSGATATSFLTLEVTRRAQLPPADPGRFVIPKDPPRDVRKYLGPSPLVESTNAKVRALAKELVGDSAAAWEQVQAIAAGVRERVTFERDPQKKFKGAAGALRDGKADREDLTATFVAICRAAKIPARIVWAMDYCYAEFYLEEGDKSDAAAGSEQEAGSDREAKAAKTGKEKKGAKSAPPRGAWYPCVLHEEVPLGAVNNFNPILEKGDNFRVPEEKAPQRIVREFFTGKGASGGKPVVEFRRRRAD
jgi:hypothetical protein